MEDNNQTDQEVEMMAEDFNKYIHNKTALYDLIKTEYSFYLPKLKSPATTVKYLLGLTTRDYYLPDIKEPEKRFYKGFSKFDFYDQIKACWPGDVGFNSTNLPDKHYLATLLYSTKPNSRLFKQKNLTQKVKISKKYFNKIS